MVNFYQVASSKRELERESLESEQKEAEESVPARSASTENVP